MKGYILHRLIYLLPVLIGVSIITFILIRIAPGDPAEILLRAEGREITEETVEIMRDRFGLNDPLPQQYLHWLKDIARFDLGTSFRTGRPVTAEIISRFPATLELTLSAMVFMIILALPAGILSALYRHSFIDNASRVIALLGVSMPNFWQGLLLIYFFGVMWNILPTFGRGGVQHLILPSVTLGFSMAAVYMRILRASILDILGEEYIKVAHARGLWERWIISRHVLKNALLPAVTLMGISMGNLLGGTVVVETIFAWPGAGKFLVEAIFNRDYPVIQGYALFIAIIFVLLNLLVDISYAFLDPRIRLGRRH